jgi:hypothetical protein
MTDSLLQPDLALEKILVGYARGYSDQQKTLNLIGALFARASASDTENLCKVLMNYFLTSDMTSVQAGGYLANLGALAMRCLVEFGSSESISRMALNRVWNAALNRDIEKMDRLAKEMLPQLQFSLTVCQDRFDFETLQSMKDSIERFSNLPVLITQSTEAALQSLHNTIEYIEFERFAKSLSGGTAKPARLSLEDPLPSKTFSPNVARALEEAGRRLREEGKFDSKIAGDLIRSIMDQVNREIVERLEALNEERCVDREKDGARRYYMRKVGLITSAEEQFFSAIYSLISQEASHKLEAPRETVLLLHQTVSNYLLLLAERLNRRESDKLAKHLD